MSPVDVLVSIAAFAFVLLLIGLGVKVALKILEELLR